MTERSDLHSNITVAYHNALRELTVARVERGRFRVALQEIVESWQDPEGCEECPAGWAHWAHARAMEALSD